MANPYAQYKQQSINTMSSGELVIKLFEEAYKSLLQADMLYNEKKADLASTHTDKAKRVFSHLISCLDMSIPVSQNLYQLYNFFNQEIIKAEIKQSNLPLQEIIPLVKDLKETWVEAEKSIHMNK